MKKFVFAVLAIAFATSANAQKLTDKELSFCYEFREGIHWTAEQIAQGQPRSRILATIQHSDQFRDDVRDILHRNADRVASNLDPWDLQDDRARRQLARDFFDACRREVF